MKNLLLILTFSFFTLASEAQDVVSKEEVKTEISNKKSESNKNTALAQQKKKCSSAQEKSSCSNKTAKKCQSKDQKSEGCSKDVSAKKCNSKTAEKKYSSEKISCSKGDKCCKKTGIELANCDQKRKDAVLLKIVHLINQNTSLLKARKYSFELF